MVDMYRIQVFFRGAIVSEHRVEASNALSAINLVEASYGEPPQVEYKTIQHEDGHTELALVVLNWHGYSFMARRIKAIE